MSDWEDYAQQVVDEVDYHFGRDIAYTCSGYSSVSIEAAFDEAHRYTRVEDGVEVSGTQPMFTVNLSLIPARPKRGDLISLGTRNFRVTVAEPGKAGKHAHVFVNEVR